MQIPPLPAVPVTPAAVQPEAVARNLPQLQAQASAPIIQRAIDPSAKSEQGNKSRSNGDRNKGGGNSGKDERGGNRGGSVNIRV